MDKKKEKFCCKECNKSYQSNSSLRRHIKNAHPDKVLADIAPTLNERRTYDYICKQCDKKFSHNFNLKQHVKYKQCNLHYYWMVVKCK